MKISKITSLLYIIALSLGSCRFQENTIFGKNNKTQVAIANLANGNYHYCSDPSPNLNEEKIDSHRYCFTFTKTDARIIGSYSYRAPKDAPLICIDGKVNNNQVFGIGYENGSPGAKQYTKKKLASLKQLPPSKKLIYWDDFKEYQGGFNLKIGSPSLHIAPLIFEDERKSYGVTKRYGVIKFDLNGFGQVEKEGLPEYKYTKCP